MECALIFPGQGGADVGMGKALADTYPEARQVLEEVNDSLGQNLTRLIFNGPKEELQLCENAQPAIFAISIATVRVFSPGI